MAELREAFAHRMRPRFRLRLPARPCHSFVQLERLRNHAGRPAFAPSWCQRQSVVLLQPNLRGCDQTLGDDRDAGADHRHSFETEIDGGEIRLDGDAAPAQDRRGKQPA